jgi:hypothetical protein
MNNWIRRSAQVGVVSAGLLAASATAAHAATPDRFPQGVGQRTFSNSAFQTQSSGGSGGNGGPGIYNGPGSVSLVNIGFGGDGGTGGDSYSGTGSGTSTGGSGGNGGPGVYNAAGSYSLVNIGIGGNGGRGGNSGIWAGPTSLGNGNYLSNFARSGGPSRFR